MVKIIQLNVNNITKNNKLKQVSLPDELSNIIKNMKEELDKRIKDSRYSTNFAVNFEKGYIPDFYAKNIALFVEKDRHEIDNAFLGISVLHPTMDIDARTYITNGKLKDLLEYVNKQDFKDELKTIIMELSEDLKK